MNGAWLALSACLLLSTARAESTTPWGKDLVADLDGDGVPERLQWRGTRLLINGEIALRHINDHEEHVKPWLELVALDPNSKAKQIAVFEPGIEDECVMRLVSYRAGRAKTQIRVWVDPCTPSVTFASDRLRVRTTQHVSRGCRTIDSEYVLVAEELKRVARVVGNVRECPPG